jgi:hypothetical protein
MDLTRTALVIIILAAIAVFLLVPAAQIAGPIIADAFAEVAIASNSQPALVVKQSTSVKYGEAVHALVKHAEATLITKCLNDQGPAMKFKHKYAKNTFYLMCQLPDTRWGFGEYLDNGTKEPTPITQFVRGSGARNEVENYLLKFATKFKGPLPWE